MRFRVFSLLLLIVSTTLSAATLDIRPVAPTNGTPVTVGATFDAICPAGPPSIQRLAGRIVITLPSTEVCMPIVPTSSHYLDLGLLPPGELTIVMQVQRGANIREVARGIVFVREQRPSLIVDPVAVPAVFGNELRILTTTTPLCPIARCTGLTVTFDGVSREAVYENGAVRVTAPPLEPGAVDVTVRAPDGTTVTQNAAFYAFDINEPPLPSVLEPVLFPVLTQTEGLFGSRWTTEAAILNGSGVTINPYNPIYPMLLCSPIPCDRILPPARYMSFTGGQYPRGALMYVPRDQAQYLDYALRVRDTSRANDDHGVELPVVREDELISEPTYRLLDVPAGPNFRTKVRIYAIDPPSDALVSVSVQAARPTLNAEVDLVQRLQLTPGRCEYDGCFPAYAEFDLPAIPPSANVDRVVINVTVSSGRSYASATVTNNRTQAVTTITPN